MRFMPAILRPATSMSFPTLVWGWLAVIALASSRLHLAQLSEWCSVGSAVARADAGRKAGPPTTSVQKTMPEST